MSERDTGMVKSSRVDIGATYPEPKPQCNPDNHEYIIQSCYELLCSGLPLTSVLDEAKRLSDMSKVNRPAEGPLTDRARPLGAIRVEQSRGIRLPRLHALTSFWLAAAVCSTVLATTAAIAVVAHLPVAAEAISPVNTPSTAARSPAATMSLEPVVLVTEASPDGGMPAGSGEEATTDAPTPMSNLFDFARQDPLTVTNNRGLAHSVHVKHPRYTPRPALAGVGGRDNYNPAIPSPYDSAYDRVVSDHFRNPGATGFYEPGHSKPVWPGIIPYRVRVGDSVLQYDGLLGRYVPLARSDTALIAAALPAH